MRDFVKKAERQSRENINRDYREIDDLHWQINFLNDMLLRYMNKKTGNTLTHSQRQKIMEEIRASIPETYKYINYYKECINAEKKEMKRIHSAYGYSYDIKPEYYTEDELIQYNDYKPEDNSEYDTYDSGDEYVPPYTQEDEELEEIKEYKYNFATGLFE